VTVPTWRARDLLREIDLVEELARFRLDDIPFTLPQRTAMFGRLAREQRLRRVVEDVLAGVGFAEAYTPSLVSNGADTVRLVEPLTSEHTALRTSLLPSLVHAAQHNLDAANREVALFELARVYRPSDGELPDERWHAAGIATGGIAVAKRAVEQLYGALRVELAVQRGQGELFHPGRAGSLQYGVFGELRPGLLEGKWGAFELDLDSLFDATPARLQFEDLLSFPAVRQDLAFVVAEGVSSAELVAAMREAAGSELRDVRVFDEYKSDELGPGRKSLAFAVSFQSPERTLTDEDAAQLRRLVVDALAERFGAELRA
jgi:phenylalanyl-tRNA synthetase beta chain